MSMWATVLQLPPEILQKVRAIYDNRFPIEVRHYLANWIENIYWAQEPEERQQFFVQELVQEIHNTTELMVTTDMFITQINLLEAAKRFEEEYSHAPQELFARMQQCLTMELEVINDATGTQHVHEPYTDPKHGKLMTEFQDIREKVKAAKEEIRKLHANIEYFSLNNLQYFKNKRQLESLMRLGPLTSDNLILERNFRSQIESLEKTLNLQTVQIKQALTEQVDCLNEKIPRLCRLQTTVLDELTKWKREQQLSGNGVPIQLNLDTIQERCEILAELLWAIRQQVSNVAHIFSKRVLEVQSPHLKDMVDEINKQVTSLLSTLVSSTFVIEKQPPQVLKTNTSFDATVRLLVGGQLNLHMNPPSVIAGLISEREAQILLGNKNRSGKAQAPSECGVILNKNVAMEYQPTKKQLSASFRNMQLRNIQRSEKKGSDSVMDMKLAFYFRSEFSVGGGELEFQVWTLSLPVVVVVHGNQEPQTWATVTWDNAFSQLDRVLFSVPDKVSWPQLAETLCTKFNSATGGNLSEENLLFLAEKMFRTSIPAWELESKTVTWTQFCKDHLPGRNYTFWEWYYNAIKITKDYLKNLWSEGLIMGFIQKQQAEDILSKCRPGTFLIRFSDSALGAITIAWVSDTKEVLNLQPFLSRDLKLRSLADRVLDLNDLQYLYPNTPKNDKFSKHYTKREKGVGDGYVVCNLKITLPLHATSSSSNAVSLDSQHHSLSVESNRYEEEVSATMAECSLMDEIDFLGLTDMDWDDFYDIIKLTP